MKIYEYPSRAEWQEITERPSAESAEIDATVREIAAEVLRAGDEAVLRFGRQFDGAGNAGLRISRDEFDRAAASVPPDLKDAIETAGANIERFHEAQRSGPMEIETFPGVVCGRRAVPIERVGIYVPGGTAPLFSTVMMLAIPARIAGCREIVMCTPPARNGRVPDAILYAAQRFGVTAAYRVGGAQAIAAMANGTESIPKVEKIFGPGNRYVTAAKMLASAAGVAIDMPAGPSELAVFADESCVPAFVAADLLSQAEHGTDSQVMLVTDSEKVPDQVRGELVRQLESLPRKQTARGALENSRIVVVRNREEAIELLNDYAAEHLIAACKNADEFASLITNAGSIFIGNYSCESAGDYASGTNHTLPTNGFAKSYSGVSLDSFMKFITYQKITADGIAKLGPVIERLASAEGLEAHRYAAAIRNEAVEMAAAGSDDN